MKVLPRENIPPRGEWQCSLCDTPIGDGGVTVGADRSVWHPACRAIVAPPKPAKRRPPPAHDVCARPVKRRARPNAAKRPEFPRNPKPSLYTGVAFGRYMGPPFEDEYAPLVDLPLPHLSARQF